ncbi:hypothetical protein BGZ46_001127 [Entomortierella lignicola]|nr:hypothetical protein BGZ46_001127 [Entomortierella lignicola]
MNTASAESARTLTQAVLLAQLCDRYHDLASYASEPLKQRIHFLARSDGSNLKKLFIWDLLANNNNNNNNNYEEEQEERIENHIQQHWSADQLPLNPPNNAHSWESTVVYYKALDSETVQAIVPIGQLDNATITNKDSTSAAPNVVVVILLSEVDETGPCWKYHNMAILEASDLQTGGWNPLTDLPLLNNEQVDVKPIKDDDDDSDDDYWGQYGEEENESPSDEDSSQIKAQEVSPETARNLVHEDDDDEDEDDYWNNYAEQQKKQEEAERKRNLQQQQQDTQTSVSEIDVQNMDLQKTLLASLPSIGSSTGPLESTTHTIGQLDQTQMLSSLLQMMVTDNDHEIEDVAQLSRSSHETNENPLPLLFSNTKTPLNSAFSPAHQEESIRDMLRKKYV